MTLYDKIMEYAQPEKPYVLKPPEILTVYATCCHVVKCTYDMLQTADVRDVAEDAIETIAFCTKIIRFYRIGAGSDYGRKETLNYRFSAYEIKMMYKIMEGCYSCGDRLNCPHSRNLKYNGTSELTKSRVTRTVTKLRKLMEEINEHNNNEMSTLGS